METGDILCCRNSRFVLPRFDMPSDWNCQPVQSAKGSSCLSCCSTIFMVSIHETKVRSLKGTLQLRLRVEKRSRESVFFRYVGDMLLAAWT